jgi:hypothetical protein
MLNTEHELARGLFGAWIFNEGSGNKVFDYASGNHGDLKNDVVFGSGTVGPVADFQNVSMTDDDHIDLNYLDVPSNTDQLTIICKVKMDQFYESYDHRFIAKQSSTSEQDHCWMFGTYGTPSPLKLRVRLRTGGDTKTHRSLSSLISAGTWHQAAVTYGRMNGAQSIIFNVDGVDHVADPSSVDVGQQSGIINLSDSVESYIGNGENSGSFYGAIDGQIEYIYMYTRALSVLDLARIYKMINGVN